MAKEFNGGLLLFDWRDLTFTEHVATDKTIQIWNPTDEDYDTYGESYYRLLQAKNKKVVYIALPKGIKNASLEYDSDNDVFNLYADSDIYEIKNDGTVTHSSILDEVNLSDYYTKTQVDTKLGDKLNKASENNEGEFGYNESGYPVISNNDGYSLSLTDEGLTYSGNTFDEIINVDNDVLSVGVSGIQLNPSEVSSVVETFSATPTGHQLQEGNLASLTQEQVKAIKNNMLYWIKKGYVKFQGSIIKIRKYKIDNLSISFECLIDMVFDDTTGTILNYSFCGATLNLSTSSYTDNYYEIDLN